MNDAPADRWEFSLLVDRANRILEARGLYEQYLGTRPGQLVNRHLVAFIAESGRLAFLRYMARLVVHGEAETVTVTLATPAIGVKRFAMAAKQGEGGANWWLMFAQDEPAGATLDTMETTTFATTDELAMLADAHDHAKSPLDLTLFRAEALSAGRGLSPTGRKVLDEELGEALLDHAHERVVARPEIGEYALLHSPDKDARAIRQSLVEVAEHHDFPPKQLGLSQETRKLGAEVSAAVVIQEMRRKIRDGDPASRAVKMPIWIPAAKWVPTAITGGCALIILLVWLLVRR